MAELTRGAFLPPVQYRVRTDPVQNRVKDVCKGTIVVDMHSTSYPTVNKRFGMVVLYGTGKNT